MKLTTIFLIASMVQVSAATMAQQVTLKKDNLSYKQLFKEVRKQTGYSIIWESEKFNANERLAVNFNKTSLREVFEKIVASKGYSYLIEETTIIIQNKQTISTGTLDSDKKINTIDVTGRVVDESGIPLGGASVVRKLDGKGTLTAPDGTFQIGGVEEGSLLIIKYVGFESRELRATKNLGYIKLTTATSKLFVAVVNLMYPRFFVASNKESRIHQIDNRNKQLGCCPSSTLYANN